MTVEYLRYTIPEDRQGAFIEDYKAAMMPLLQSPYARSFDLCQCDDDPSKFILRIEWTSASDHMEGFRGSAEFRQFLGHIRAYIGDIEEMRHYTRLLAS